MRVKHFISKCIAKCALLSVTLSLFLSSLVPLAANAANITSLKDTMTRVKVGSGGTTVDASSVTSNHVFSFTLPTAWLSDDAVYIDFSASTAGDFIANATSNWAASDFTIDGLLNVASGAETEVVQLGTFAVDSSPTIAEISFPACSPDTTADVVVSGLFTTTTLLDPIIGFKRCGSTTTEGGTSITITLTTEAATNGQIENPSASGSHLITVCHDNGANLSCADAADNTAQLAVGIASADQVTSTATVVPSLTFSVGATTTACNTSAPSNGTIAFGTLSTATVYSSGKSSGNPSDGDTTTKHICTLVSTNATGGAAVTVKGSALGLASTSSDDIIDSATGTMSTATENFGLCVASDAAETATSGTVLSAQGIFDTAPCASGGAVNAVGAITTSPVPILAQTTGPVSQSYANIRVNVNITALTESHNDYTLTMTFIATGTF